MEHAVSSFQKKKKQMYQISVIRDIIAESSVPYLKQKRKIAYE